ncbi:MAG: sulfite exporter TauE/SafE family protein [Alphaproteobacteria bacterium]|nr:sulfite exporter TauE/SafE family protein [Alphaproteobacteria bacterium]
MEIYLPVAQTSVNWAMILSMGIAVGFLAGMLGVGGGFVMTPLLIFYGIPPAIAVATQASPISAASFVGALSQGAKNSVDFKMGSVLLIGGLAGSAIGVVVFNILQRLGLLDFVVEFGYVLLLTSIGGLMLKESIQVILAARRGVPIPSHQPGQHNWIHNLPLKMRFRRSRLYISAIPVVVLGLSVGVLTAILGTGGAFMLIPAKIYLLRMRTDIAVGTSQFQVFFVAAMTTLLHAVSDHTVDIVLAGLLIIGGVFGAQMGIRIGSRLRGEEMRAALAILILGIAFRLLIGVVLAPADVYSVVPQTT